MGHTVARRKFLGISFAAFAGAWGHRIAQAQQAAWPFTVEDHIRQLAAEAPLAMQFRGSTAAECEAWQAGFGAKLRSLLGPHQAPAKWTTTVERVVELEDHRREELILSADGHPSLPVYLLVPTGPADRARPGVVAIHGHGPFGYDHVGGRDDLPEVAEYLEGNPAGDFGRQLVRRGYVVAVPCMMPFGRRLPDADKYGDDPCGVTYVRLSLLGKLLMAENLRDCLWALELLAQHKQVDADRLGCVGHSYGGRMCMLAAAVEPRIRIACPSGALNLMQERIGGRYGCGGQVIPGLLQYGDVPEIAGLIAPRWAVWIAGKQDNLIKPEWMDKALPRMRRVYQALGAEDRLVIDHWDGPHQWHGDVAVPLMDKVLGNEG